MKLISIVITSLAVSVTTSIAQTITTTTDHSKMDHSNMQMSEDAIEGAVHTKAIINSISDGMANVSHEPIKEIGWPAMTMDLMLREDAVLMDDFVPGASVVLMLIKGENGMYEIGAIMLQ